MKFGQSLARCAWRAAAVDYKRLKQLIKACAGVPPHRKLDTDAWAALQPAPHRCDQELRSCTEEKAFFLALDHEIRRVNHVYRAWLGECLARFQALGAALLTSRSAHARRVCLRHCGRVYHELLTLEHYCVMNFCAIVNALKKHDKWTGYSTQARYIRAVASTQPFATYVPLLQLLRRVHALAVGFSVALDLHDPSATSAGVAGLTDDEVDSEATSTSMEEEEDDEEENEEERSVFQYQYKRTADHLDMDTPGKRHRRF